MKTPAERKNPMRRAELREHAVPGALSRRRVLDRQDHGASPLAAEAEALAEPAEREQERRRKADRRICRQRADRHRRYAHRQQRRHERGLAADAVAEVAEERRPDRPRQECDPEGGERRERGRRRVRRRKEQAGKDEHRGGRVDVEVEELDGRADEAGKQHLSRPVCRPDGSARRRRGRHHAAFGLSGVPGPVSDYSIRLERRSACRALPKEKPPPDRSNGGSAGPSPGYAGGARAARVPSAIPGRLEASRPIGFRLCLVHLECTTVHLVAVQALDAAGGIRR